MHFLGPFISFSVLLNFYQNYLSSPGGVFASAMAGKVLATVIYTVHLKAISLQFF